MAAPLSLTVNGRPEVLAVSPDLPLLTALRRHLGLKGARFGCGEGQCGACTVLVDGRAMQACQTPLWSVEGRSVTTIEGLAVDGEPGPIQQAFLDEQAAQCGYCTNGIIMTLASLLSAGPRPSRSAVIEALDERHLCRCGAHPRILRAVDRLLENAPHGSPDLKVGAPE
jgi:nicotinate dehydrogenase subunit A